MPVLIAIFAALAAAGVWYWRIRAAGEAAQGLAGAAQDVLSAARRFGFRRRYNQHPVDSLEDAGVAVAGAGVAFLELSSLPTSEQQDALLISLQSQLGYDRAKAEEAMILGRWLVNESGTSDAALRRLTRRLRKLQGVEGLQPMMAVLNDVVRAGRDGALSSRQREALDDVTRTFGLN